MAFFNNQKQRLIVPEVVQTSGMDCGPASLKSLLEGFGISANYGRLREACQTDVDGTSIDTIEIVAGQLGLEAQQTLVPPDHLLLPEAKLLPSLVVVRLPNGLTHFVVVWRIHGKFLQIMDPALGRRWVSREQFLSELYIHEMPFPAAAWREWAAGNSFISPLEARMKNLGIAKKDRVSLLETALFDNHWQPLAALDAATRSAAAIAKTGTLRRGKQATALATRFFENSIKARSTASIPAHYWTVRPEDKPTSSEEEHILLRGAVILHIAGRKPETSSHDSSEASESVEDIQTDDVTLNTELSAALTEKEPSALRSLWQFLKEDGIFSPILLSFAFLLAAGGVMIEALLLRGLLDASQELGLSIQRWGIMSAIVIFSLALLLLEIPIFKALLKFGRRVEIRLRKTFLEKIPRLKDRYFQSRLISDMAERSHSIHKIRLLPGLGGQLLRHFFELILTAAGIIWLSPANYWLALSAAALAIALPLLLQPSLAEKDLRLRNHLGALSRFHLDAMLGLSAIRTHCAEKTLRREFESLTVEWAKAGYSRQRLVVIGEALQFLSGFGLAGWLLFSHLFQDGQVGAVLLLVYWALNLPALGQEIALIAWQYPTHRNVTLRLLEPLGAPESEEAALPTTDEVNASTIKKSAGMAIEMENIHVVAAGHTILQDVNLRIEPGSHLAIVGPSGAGKSSLSGLLLGFHQAASGNIRVDGNDFDHQQQQQLHQETAWVDPSIQLWNRSFLENLQYGNEGITADFHEILTQADLREIAEKMPDGLQSQLGENGALLSGGQGQRVRLGRAMLKSDARLVILDEAFRGLDREQRQKLLARARKVWKDATLICVTHDIDVTQDFERALVMENGTIVEDAAPEQLLINDRSRYAQLLQAAQVACEQHWQNAHWRRLHLENGRLGLKAGKAIVRNGTFSRAKIKL